MSQTLSNFEYLAHRYKRTQQPDFWALTVFVFLIGSTSSNVNSTEFQHVCCANGDRAEQVSSLASLFYCGGSKYLRISSNPVVVINQNQTSVQCVIWKMKNCFAESIVSPFVDMLSLHSLKWWRNQWWLDLRNLGAFWNRGNRLITLSKYVTHSSLFRSVE